MEERKQTLIDCFHENSVKTVKINVQEWKGQLYCDVRLWSSDNPGESGAERPTHKGITLNVDLLPDLISALQKAKEVVEKRTERLVGRRSQRG
jgi:hypothetical protein